MSVLLHNLYTCLKVREKLEGSWILLWASDGICCCWTKCGRKSPLSDFFFYVYGLQPHLCHVTAIWTRCYGIVSPANHLQTVCHVSPVRTRFDRNVSYSKSVFVPSCLLLPSESHAKREDGSFPMRNKYIALTLLGKTNPFLSNKRHLLLIFLLIQSKE